MDFLKAKKVALILNAMGTAGALGVPILGLFEYRDLVRLFRLLCILSSLGAFYFWMRYPQIFTSDNKKELQKKGMDGRMVSIDIPLIVPGAMSALHMLKNCSPAVWWEPFVWAAGLMAVLFLVILRFLPEGREKPLTALFIAFFLALMQLGNIWNANLLLDFHEPETIRVVVEDLHKSRGHRSGNTYSFDTRIGGEERTIHVLQKQYYELTEGEIVVIEIHQGGLGMEYYILKETGI